MPSRNVVQDSDDEEDADAGISPAKIQDACSKGDLDSHTDGMEFVDFGSPSPPRAGSTREGNQSTGVGSSELLSQAIHKAHRDLVEPSPDAQVTALHDDGASWSLTSPVIEKVKRRKTTMEEFDSSASLGSGKSKVLKTYGSKKTRADTASRSGAVDTRWVEGWPDGGTAENNSDLFWRSQENEKRRTTVTPDDLLSAGKVLGKKRMKRSVTTAWPATEAEYIYADEHYQEPLLSLRRDPNEGLITALKASATISGKHLEHLTLPSMEKSMRPPDGKQAQQLAALDTSISSTIPDTPIEAGRSQMLPRTDQADSSARMTSPTISGKLSKEILTQSTDHVNDALEYLAGVDMEDPVINLVHSSAPKERTKIHNSTIPSRLSSTPGSAPGTEDELSMTTSKYEVLPTEVQTKKSKRKLSGNNNFDELGSDDVALGLPAEHYQPRPSRSRANRAVDDLVLAIDYSKRPEAVFKARNKRRKTEGDHLVATEQTADMDHAYTTARKEPNYNAEPDPSPQNLNTESTLPAEEVATTDGCVTKERILVSAVDSELPKKKRGRPKKQITTDNDIQIIQKVPKNVVDKAADDDLASTTTAASTAKKPRKRKKTQESIANSDEIDIEEDELSSASQPRTRGHHHADERGTTLDANQNSANIIKPRIQPIENPMQSDIECSPAPDTIQSRPPPETPKKTIHKGPGKHSPLNTGKVPYRVGLSKRARIEPLLRVVRK
ncbi:hypothetical protein MMC18_008437 [Xylographa bjoerkii]|nr:hypothetical protein [Xylographa bjoerkii]